MWTQVNLYKCHFKLGWILLANILFALGIILGINDSDFMRYCIRIMAFFIIFADVVLLFSVLYFLGKDQVEEEKL